MHPGAAELEVEPETLVEPSAAADAVSCLDDKHALAAVGEVTRGSEAREAGADDDGVELMMSGHITALL